MKQRYANNDCLRGEPCSGLEAVRKFEARAGVDKLSIGDELRLAPCLPDHLKAWIATVHGKKLARALIGHCRPHLVNDPFDRGYAGEIFIRRSDSEI